MWTLLFWFLFPLLCQRCPGARGHSLGRPATADLDQLRSVLQHLESSLSAAPDQDPEQSQDQNQDQDQDYPAPQSSRAGGGAKGAELDEARDRKLLLDFLLSARRSSSCFGARMDRIGNSGGLGCGRG